jgi:hypothetical protein
LIAGAAATASLNGRGSKLLPRRLLAFYVFVSLLLTAAAGLSHSRYPVAQQVLVDPRNAQQLWARTSYGVLVSADSGASWDWICQAGVGYSAEYDATLAITADSKVFVASMQGLFTSAAGGCAWQRAAGIGDVQINDVLVEPDGHHVLALALVPANDHYASILYRSDEQSGQFAALANAAWNDLFGHTIAVAPASSQRIYVTGSLIGGTDAAARASRLSD